ncbi:MAG TPA: ribbon-helix-helix domain-containing protein [Anaerolineales bacterium]|nr:ribbon-helix-helix domain-containing protein [Anaerolineales bacterium]
MNTSKIGITIDKNLLIQVDRLVAQRRFSNRSQAIQEAVREKLIRMQASRLAREAARLDSAFEQKLADEGLSTEAGEWPEY